MQEDGEYVPSTTSGVLPQLPIVEWVNDAVERAWTVGFRRERQPNRSLQALEEVETKLREWLK